MCRQEAEPEEGEAAEAAAAAGEDLSHQVHTIEDCEASQSPNLLQHTKLRHCSYISLLNLQHILCKSECHTRPMGLN